MIKTSDPFKLSISLLIVSILSALYIIYKTTSMWITAIILLTFSRGIIILFCYSASLINIETKNPIHLKWKNRIIIVPSIIIFNLRQRNFKTDSSMKEFTSRIIRTLLIVVVILFMTPIIENCFNPTNPIQSRF